jgi:hypothetical protein
MSELMVLPMSLLLLLLLLLSIYSWQPTTKLVLLVIIGPEDGSNKQQ